MKLGHFHTPPRASSRNPPKILTIRVKLKNGPPAQFAQNPRSYNPHLRLTRGIKRRPCRTSAYIKTVTLLSLNILITPRGARQSPKKQNTRELYYILPPRSKGKKKESHTARRISARQFVLPAPAAMRARAYGKAVGPWTYTGTQRKALSRPRGRAERRRRRRILRRLI